MSSVPEKETNNRSANSQVNGLAFQYAAAILIFIKQMKYIKAIGIEDKDDLRFYLKDGSNIYAQAKSSLEADRLYNQSHLATDIKDSLVTLYDNKDNCSKLISIFNYHNPFGEQPTFNDTKNMVKLFHNLTSSLKTKISAYCKDDREMLEKLEFWFLRFEDDNDPFIDITSIVDDAIRLVDNRNVHSKDLVEKWRCMMEINGRNKKDLIDVNYIIGSIFSHILANAIRFSDVCSILNLDDIDFSANLKMSQLFLEHFRKLISFEEYAKVLSAFSSFKENNPILNNNKNKLYTEFAESFCNSINSNVRMMFEDDEEPDKLAISYQKIFTIACAMKGDVIRKIKEIFNYEN